MRETGIGLRRGTVTLRAHDAGWEEKAAETVALLRSILGKDAMEVRHVGSTSIKGIRAKPILDIAIGAGNLRDMEKHHAALAEKGIVFRKEERPDEWLYVMGDLENDCITHHIHAVLYGGEPWQNYVRFTAYMNSHPEDAAAYDALKGELAARCANDRKAYTAGKEEFIREMLRKAREWESVTGAIPR